MNDSNKLPENSMGGVRLTKTTRMYPALFSELMCVSKGTVSVPFVSLCVMLCFPVACVYLLILQLTSFTQFYVCTPYCVYSFFLHIYVGLPNNRWSGSHQTRDKGNVAFIVELLRLS